MSNKIVTLKDKDDEVVIPIGTGYTNCNAEWFTVKLDRIADGGEKTLTTRNGGEYTFQCHNGGTGWSINSSNRAINLFRVRTEFRATGGEAIGAHQLKSGSTIWTRVYGDYKEGMGAQIKREGSFTVAASENYGSVIVIGNSGNLSGRLYYTMMRERADGGWRCFCDFGTGYNVNWNSLDVELTAKDANVGPTLYIRGVNNSNIVDAYSVIDILEEK